jgi:TPR repeat protein
LALGRENGDGVPIDLRGAAHYFKLAADQGLLLLNTTMDWLCDMELAFQWT